MNESDIRVGSCYRLINGKIVRVTSIANGAARCDAYSERERKWIVDYVTYPFTVIKEPVDDPSVR